MEAKVLFIDNFDSFTYNLVDDFCKRDCQAKVYRADTELDQLKSLAEDVCGHGGEYEVSTMVRILTVH